VKNNILTYSTCVLQSTLCRVYIPQSGSLSGDLMICIRRHSELLISPARLIVGTEKSEETVVGFRDVT